MTVADKKVKKVKSSKLKEQQNVFSESMMWSYDGETKVLEILLPDNGESTELFVVTK